MKIPKALISICRTRCSTEGDYMVIRITDDRSGCVMVEAKMGLLEFVNTLTGQSHCEGTAEFNDSGVIGKQYEHKTVAVQIGPHNSSHEGARDRAIQKAFKKYEKDGWEGRVEDAKNHHNTFNYERDGRYKANVVFVRYV